MLRPKLADLAREAKKIKAAPLKATAAAGGSKQPRPRAGGLAHFRVLESPGCRRVVLTGPSGRLDGKAAESLLWKLRAWENNYLVKAVLLQGRRDGHGGKQHFFSGGWERGGKQQEQGDQRLHALQRYTQLAYLLATLSKPTVAWLNGEVLGSGLGLGLARLRVATKSSRFRVDAAKRGWALDGGLSFALPRLRAGADPGVAGGPEALAMARYLALTGGILYGADMLACGLATHLMDDAAAAVIHKRCVPLCWSVGRRPVGGGESSRWPVFCTHHRPHSSPTRRLADLAYEPDHMVEEALSEHATMFYKVDARLNPGPYRDLWAEWARNDEAREQ